MNLRRFVLGLSVLTGLLPAQVTKEAGGAIPTATGFWSTSGMYAGSGQCATCHPAQSKTFASNSMSKALESIDRCEILQGDIHFTFQNDSYRYSLTRSGEKVIYRVTDGRASLEAPIEYAFGQGKAGQTYLFQKDGEYFESRVSYYASIRGLDLTVGARNQQPRDLLEAAGRVMKGAEPRNCFGCHTTGARVGASLQLTHFEQGVLCESCHGPGGLHVSAMQQGDKGGGSIRSLKGMGPQQSNEFCGACHRTWEAVMMMGLRGPNTARFPSYRLTGSPCFSLDDTRISCTACHDPHGPLVAEDRYYDTKCTACHNAADKSVTKKTCPISSHDCTSCHMQRVDSAEAHHAFPDHWIRVVKSKADYPE